MILKNDKLQKDKEKGSTNYQTLSQKSIQKTMKIYTKSGWQKVWKTYAKMPPFLGPKGGQEKGKEEKGRERKGKGREREGKGGERKETGSEGKAKEGSEAGGGSFTGP